jgi:hypothetical protein
MATKQQIAESLEHFESLLVLAVSCDATNEKAIELAKSVNKKHHIMFWSRIDLSTSNIVFKALDVDDDEFFSQKVEQKLSKVPKMTKVADLQTPCQGRQLRLRPLVGCLRIRLKLKLLVHRGTKCHPSKMTKKAKKCRKMPGWHQMLRKFVPN